MSGHFVPLVFARRCLHSDAAGASRRPLPGRFQIAIDGVSATGKTQTAKELARRLPGFLHIDSGAMYRAPLKPKPLSPPTTPSPLSLVRHPLLLTPQPTLALLTVSAWDSRDVTLSIRDPVVTRSVSTVAAHGGVREVLVALQRQWASGDESDEFMGVVMDGRDVGAHVLVDAHVKIYLDGGVKVRAWRRLRELVLSSGVEGLKVEGGMVFGENVEKALKEMEDDLVERDRRDMERTMSPLRKAKEAIVVDTSGLSLDEQVAMIEALARVRMAVWRESIA
ncbi:P-loop containing nucleoside triphosphate hydrolase protein [Chytridium lagenaria]|nr:P-loop containing nucleoside triphosphate hydrolase protein [Chytridium lagenaria]